MSYRFVSFWPPWTDVVVETVQSFMYFEDHHECATASLACKIVKVNICNYAYLCLGIKYDVLICNCYVAPLFVIKLQL